MLTLTKVYSHWRCSGDSCLKILIRPKFQTLLCLSCLFTFSWNQNLIWYRSVRKCDNSLIPVEWPTRNWDRKKGIQNLTKLFLDWCVRETSGNIWTKDIFYAHPYNLPVTSETFPSFLNDSKSLLTITLCPFNNFTCAWVNTKPSKLSWTLFFGSFTNFFEICWFWWISILFHHQFSLQYFMIY